MIGELADSLEIGSEFTRTVAHDVPRAFHGTIILAPALNLNDPELAL